MWRRKTQNDEEEVEVDQQLEIQREERRLSKIPPPKRRIQRDSWWIGRAGKGIPGSVVRSGRRGSRPSGSMVPGKTSARRESRGLQVPLQTLAGSRRSSKKPTFQPIPEDVEEPRETASKRSKRTTQGERETRQTSGRIPLEQELKQSMRPSGRVTEEQQKEIRIPAGIREQPSAIRRSSHKPSIRIIKPSRETTRATLPSQPPYSHQDLLPVPDDFQSKVLTRQDLLQVPDDFQSKGSRRSGHPRQDVVILPDDLEPRVTRSGTLKPPSSVPVIVLPDEERQDEAPKVTGLRSQLAPPYGFMSRSSGTAPRDSTPPPPPRAGFLSYIWRGLGEQSLYDWDTKRPSVVLPILLEDEKRFHELVTEGRVTPLAEFLDERPSFNINCIDFQGVSALQIAVKQGNEPMVDYLLSLSDIDIGDSHLFAIRDNQPGILVKILDRLEEISPGLEFMACANSAEFADNVTPLILAAEAGDYEIIGLLIDRGHIIPRPHNPRCFCQEECLPMLQTQDLLSVSSGKLHIYRAVSNPAYVCQTSEDPILTSFILSKELLTCGTVDMVFLSQYRELAQGMRTFAAELIAECRSSEEVDIVLSETRGSKLKTGTVYPRLIMAVEYKQKEFVAQPNVQQVLEQKWLGEWYQWKGYNKTTKMSYILLRVFMLPLIFGILMVRPQSSWAKFYAVPINKLLSHNASYLIFLLLLFVQSDVDKAGQTRDIRPTGVEFFIVVYVLTYLYGTLRLLVVVGARRFLSFLWNVYELLMEILFLCTFLFWTIAAVRTTISGEQNMERKYWHYLDAELIAEGLFCVAVIMAYMKIMLILQISYEIGPLQVSLGKMTNDCSLYSIIFTIILVAFTAGLCKLYNYYEGMVQKNPDTGEVDSTQENSFVSILDTFKTLFWGLFGMVGFEAADVVIENLKDEKGEPTIVNQHHFTEAVGYFIFALYMVLTVIVILNMLIATMSNTFQRVTDNVDTEWLYGRTEVYLSYMNQSVLPPPFNVLPTTYGLLKMMKGFRARVRQSMGDLDEENSIRETELKKMDFHVLMSQLVQRYFSTKSEDI